MDKEIILLFLNKYNYNYLEKKDFIFIQLDFAQQIKIDFSQPDKIIITEKLVSWNFLTGIIEMSLKNALIYNFVGTIIFGFLCLYSLHNSNGFDVTALFLLFITWIIIFSGFYLIKLEDFKTQVINCIK